MEEQLENDQNSEKDIPKKDIGNIWSDFTSFLKEILDIRHDTDKKGTIEDVKGNISMKGHTAWVLIFSIWIASIGLNISSPAVVIGAMLISPLMGPILGIGLSIGTNDIDTLKRSFINLGVMIGLSLVTSFLFFKIPIFQDLTPEIKARTAPDARDVFIAIGGGLALILALSRRSKQTNTIAGVAIATALMPPLCVAGYGLAVWNLTFFWGAMFLFTINTIFIALATFLIVKFLKFPMVKYINSAKRKRISQLATTLAIIIFSFSVFLFYKLYRVDQFSNNAKHLIDEMKASGIHIFDINNESINFKNKEISIIIYGNPLSESEMNHWKSKLGNYDLEDSKLIIEQSQSTDLNNKVEELTHLYASNQEIIVSRDTKIEEKEEEVNRLQKELNKYYSVDFNQISKEAFITFDGLKTMSYGNLITTNFKKTDTIALFATSWKEETSNKREKDEKLRLWLKVRLKLDSVQIIKH
ncbi:MAG: DUF389 domain-containing protein [Flavobacteriaceae bacterium]|nr:DUF389 domain-containing protein [Flavobacteriaceae bacterium]